MRILYICINNLVTEVSGPKAHVESICDAFGKSGHKVLLVRPKGHFPKENNRTTLFKTLYLPNFVLSDRTLKHRFVIDFLYLLIITFYRPQMIFERETGRRSFAFLSNLFGIPRIVELNGWTLNQSENAADNEKYSIARYKKDFKGAKAIVVSSPNLKNKIVENINFEPDRIHFVPNGVDINKFSPPEKFPIRKNERTIVGYVGGFTYYQDILTIIKAFDILLSRGYEAELRMIGDYSQMENIINHTKISKNSVEHISFLGAIEHDRIPEELWQMDICVAAYKKELIETIGSLEGAMKLWEYWASCRPVICTDIKSSSSYHHHQEKRYLAVEPENPVEMTDAIQYLIDHPEEKNKLAERGFLFVKEENSWDKAVSKIETIMLKD